MLTLAFALLITAAVLLAFAAYRAARRPRLDRRLRGWTTYNDALEAEWMRQRFTTHGGMR